MPITKAHLIRKQITKGHILVWRSLLIRVNFLIQLLTHLFIAIVFAPIVLILRFLGFFVMGFMVFLMLRLLVLGLLVLMFS